MVETRVFVHVILDGLSRSGKTPGRRPVEDWLALTETLDSVLGRYADGWSRPSVDEAVFAGDEPWDGETSPLDWAEQLRSDVRSRVGLDCSVGIAGTRIAARVCARLARPSGALLWISGYERGLLDGLPLEELDELRPAQLEKLRSRGVATLGDLAALSPLEARDLVGADAERLIGLVRGNDRDPHGSADPGSNATGEGRLSRAVDLLVRRLERRLAQQRKRARGLELKLVYADGVTRERYLLLPRPTSEAGELREAARRLVDLQSKRGEAIGGVALTATGLTGLTGASSQLELFHPVTRGRARRRELRVNLGTTAV